MATLPDAAEVVAESQHDRHSRLLVRSPGPLLNPALAVSPADLEDIVLAYLEQVPAREPASAVVR
ncbi:MAG TPA: hypothetical protein VGJ38_04270 [Jatrophihabitantaceae bacterium]